MLPLFVLAAFETTGTPMLVRPEEASAYATLLHDEALAADARFSTSRCDGARVEVLSREVVRIGDRPDIAAARERVRVIGCGRSNVENLAVARLGGDQPWKVVSDLPGDTLASMPLQQAATSKVLADMQTSVASDCKTIALADIYVAARPGKVRFTNIGQSSAPGGKVTVSAPDAIVRASDTLDAKAAWAEVWPLTACGANRDTMVVFIPNRQSSASVFFDVPVWQMEASHGPGARPAADPS